VTWGKVGVIMAARSIAALVPSPQAAQAPARPGKSESPRGASCSASDSRRYFSAATRATSARKNLIAPAPSMPIASIFAP